MVLEAGYLFDRRHSKHPPGWDAVSR